MHGRDIGCEGQPQSSHSMWSALDLGEAIKYRLGIGDGNAFAAIMYIELYVVRAAAGAGARFIRRLRRWEWQS